LGCSLQRCTHLVVRRAHPLRKERNEMRCILALTAIVSWSIACTTVMYSGPRRSADEVAVLVTSSDEIMIGNGGQSEVSTTLAKIDGKEAKGSSFELLPGRHSVEVTGWKRDMPGGRSTNGLVVATAILASHANAKESSPLVACFIAQPGHTYGVRTFGNAGSWVIEIIDQNTTEVETSGCPPAMNRPTASTARPSPSTEPTLLP
jgi:hypothetical protein